MYNENDSQPKNDLDRADERYQRGVRDCFLGVVIPALPHFFILLWLFDDSSRSGSWAGMLIFPYMLIGLMPTLVINIIWTAMTFAKNHSKGLVFLRGMLVSIVVPFLVSPILFGVG